MNRAHVYIVPEEEIGIQPTIYGGYIRKYGKVIFVVDRLIFDKVDFLWKDFVFLFKNAKGESNDEKYRGIMSILNEKHNYMNNEVIGGIFITMMTILAMPLKFDNEEYEKKVHIIISNPNF
jgi:hypothetical protein